MPLLQRDPLILVVGDSELVQVDGPTPDLVVKRDTLASNSVFVDLCAFQETPCAVSHLQPSILP